MRIFRGIWASAVLAGTLAACGSAGDTGMASNEDGGKLDCALGGAADFKPVCQVERVYKDGAQEVIFRHPDGGFHRFALVPGKGLETADGSEDAVITALASNRIQVIVGSDRYQLAATVKPGAGEAMSPDTPAA